MSDYVNRADVLRYVVDALPDGESAKWDTGGIVDDVIEAWPDLIGYHDGIRDHATPDALATWLDEYIRTTDCGLERYRCARGEDAFWGIVAEHQRQDILAEVVAVLAGDGWTPRWPDSATALADEYGNAVALSVDDESVKIEFEYALPGIVETAYISHAHGADRVAAIIAAFAAPLP